MLSDEIQGCLKVCSNILCGKMQILGAVTEDNQDDFSALKSAADFVNSLLNDEDADPAEVVNPDGRSIGSLYRELMEIRHARK
jgi:hypothetical protein